MTTGELINDPNYKLAEIVPLAEMNAWLQKISKSENESKKTLVPETLKGILFLVFCLLLGYYLGKNLFGNPAIKSNFLIFLFIFPLLAIHELIHGIAFKYYGAPKIGFGANWKSLMIYAYAQDFPVNMKQLKVIALAPFICITIVLLICSFLFKNFSVGFIFLTILHAFMCMGDFLLVKYANKHPENMMYDDVENTKSMYFYQPNI